jgi:uncharacterized Tic20 family protein
MTENNQPLDHEHPVTVDEQEDYRPWNMEVNQFCTLLHLSQFAGFIVPFGGIILPIIMWTTNKEQSSLVDRHGKNVLNWMISSFIYVIISIILMIILIGIPVLIAVLICSFVFTVIGAVRASEGIVYEYPMSIKFFK